MKQQNCQFKTGLSIYVLALSAMPVMHVVLITNVRASRSEEAVLQ
jgi:hypothetical protein